MSSSAPIRAKVQLMQVDKRGRTINPKPVGLFCLSQSTSVVYDLCTGPSELMDLSELKWATRLIPELQDAGDVPRGENPPHVVEVSHVQTTI